MPSSCYGNWSATRSKRLRPTELGRCVSFSRAAHVSSSSLTQPTRHGVFRARTVLWLSAHQEASWPSGNQSRAPTNPQRTSPSGWDDVRPTTTKQAGGQYRRKKLQLLALGPRIATN
jgi:hypothetical protein